MFVFNPSFNTNGPWDSCQNCTHNIQQNITGPKILEIDLSSVRSKSFIEIEVTVSLEQSNTMDYARILLSPFFINNKEKK